jgi:hypothetical protein
MARKILSRRMVGQSISYPYFGGPAQSWQAYTNVPPGWNWTLPFTIQQNGRDFRVDPSFSLQAHAGITVAKTYYVNRAMPDNTGDGLTPATALQKVSTALGKADVDQIMILGNGNVYEMGFGWDGLSPARSIEVIGYGSTPPVLSYHHAGLTWAVEDAHYKATETNFIWKVFDRAVLDANGDYTQYTKLTSVAGVDAQAGSFWYDDLNDILYVKTIDGRPADADLIPYVNGGYIVQNDAVTYYLENLHVYGGSSGINPVSANAAAKFFGKDLVIKYSTQANGLRVQGCGEVILQNCTAAANDVDGFKFEEQTGAYCNAALINCIGRHNGLPTENADNGYSRHDRGQTIVLGGSYYGNYGPNINSIDAGVGDPFDWLVGVSAYGSNGTTSNINFSIGTSTTGGASYLDYCTSSGSTTDLAEGTNATMYYRELVSGGVFTGTPEAY